MVRKHEDSRGPRQYRGVADEFGRYWAAYGGWGAALRSPYFGAAAVLTAISWHSWWRHDWADTAISVLPNLLGFSLGGYAMLVGFGDDKFKNLLSTTDGHEDGTAIFTEISASFAHFIVVQALALIAANTSRATYFELHEGSFLAFVHDHQIVADILLRLWWGGGFFLFTYALVLTIATAMAVFRLTGWFVKQQRRIAAARDERAHDENVDAGQRLPASGGAPMSRPAQPYPRASKPSSRP